MTLAFLGYRKANLNRQFNLVSATQNLSFQGRIHASYRHRNRDPRYLESLISHHLRTVAESISSRWEVDESTQAQDEINLNIGLTNEASLGGIRRLIASIELDVSDTDAKSMATIRSDRIKVDRLRYLRDCLYSDPTLMLIQEFESHPQSKVDPSRLDAYRRLADSLRHSEQWWSPIMAAWNELARQCQNEATIDVAMNVLIHAIKSFDARLADKLPTEVQGQHLPSSRNRS